jgi:hypothetical protein
VDARYSFFLISTKIKMWTKPYFLLFD